MFAPGYRDLCKKTERSACGLDRSLRHTTPHFSLRTPHFRVLCFARWPLWSAATTNRKIGRRGRRPQRPADAACTRRGRVSRPASLHSTRRGRRFDAPPTWRAPVGNDLPDEGGNRSAAAGCTVVRGGVLDVPRLLLPVCLLPVACSVPPAALFLSSWRKK